MKFLKYTVCLLLCVQIHFVTSGVLKGISDKISEELHTKHNSTKALNGEVDLGFVTISGDLTVNKETGFNKKSTDGNVDLDFEKEKKVDVNLGIHGKPIIHNLLHPDDKAEYSKTIGLSSDRTTSLHLGSKVGKALKDFAEKVPSTL